VRRRDRRVTDGPRRLVGRGRERDRRAALRRGHAQARLRLGRSPQQGVDLHRADLRAGRPRPPTATPRWALRGMRAAVLRIAHVSDLHVLSPFGAEWRSIVFNKRITSYANLLLQRGRVYRPEHLDRVLSAAAERANHVVVTGDITNVSLASEYAEARRRLDRVAAAAEVTVVPGNHDIYLPAVSHDGRFWRSFSPYLQSDLPELAVEVAAGRFPFIKLRGPLALIGLSTAVPRPPFVSAGWLGHGQLAALQSALAHPEVARRVPIVLLHHDPLDTPFPLEQLRSG